ncbi:MAG: Periplasmic copper-binding protein (NosD) [Methanosaeta sp. PtaU1.Bin028]|nr:MAG: Periplasmic copper-binding protein (NosD) [Methanosaeta sp. PtaU1.Bin028]
MVIRRMLLMATFALLVTSAGHTFQAGFWGTSAIQAQEDDAAMAFARHLCAAILGASQICQDAYPNLWDRRVGLQMICLLRPLSRLISGWNIAFLTERYESDHARSAGMLIVVPDDYPTIQEAIDAACPGGTVKVRSGTYRENVDVHEQLTLWGVDSGQGMPVIDARAWVSGVTLRRDGIILAGFVITNSSLGAGVDVQSDCNVIIDNNITGNTINGVKFRGRREGNIVSQNRIIENGFSGISFEAESVDNTVIGNDIIRNGFGGISFGAEALRNLVTENNISQNGFVGVQFKARSTDNYVLENLVIENNFGGIDLLGNASCNLITGNLLVRNNFTGLSLSKNTSCNKVFQNYLLQNTKHGASDEGSGNLWDDGTAGNYHSDFKCEDKDNNGICDSAFGIYGGMGSDRYPLSSIPEAIARTIPAG